ncbi:MAG: TRAP transporter small permease [Campylobacteraceae bacterium]|jgi:C4-dicarboxylate transporter DctQ subunit|nr:TRAP transporter small permease [Campylobacteraceae bacterium]
MFKKAFDFVDTIVVTMNKTIAVGGMVLGVLLAFINVVLRYVWTNICLIAGDNTTIAGKILGIFFNYPCSVFDGGLPWAFELTNYLFIWSALFGAAYGFKKGIHISVTLLLHAFPVKIAKLFVIFSSAFSCLFLLVMAYYGGEILLLTASFGETSPDLWNMPIWIPMIVLPLSFAAASFRAGEKVYEFAKTPANEILKTSEDELVHDSAVKE